MKYLKFFLLIPLFAAFAFVSIKKKQAAGLPFRVYGSWFGKYGNGTERPGVFYAFHFKYTGYVVVESSSEATPKLATGKWQLVGDSVVLGTYSYVYGSSGTFSFAMKVTSGSAIGVGTWGVNSSTVGGGKFEVKKE
jgi:hypothetical protein